MFNIRNVNNNDNMAEVKTYEDGWDCEPKLKEAVNEIDKCHHFIYEINNCVRSSELDYMVYEMRDFLNAAICKLDEIDVKQEFKTIEDER